MEDQIETACSNADTCVWIVVRGCRRQPRKSKLYVTEITSADRASASITIILEYKDLVD